MAMATSAAAQTAASQYGNLATIAIPTGSGRPSSSLEELRDGLTPTPPGDRRGNRTPRLGSQWLQYEWLQPVHIKEIALFWWNYGNAIRLTEAYRISWWDGHQFIPVKDPSGFGLVNSQYNITTFDEVTTTRLRLDVDSVDRWSSTGSIDHQDINQSIGATWSDGSPPLAIPNDARLNRADPTPYPQYTERVPTSIIWIKK